MNDEYTCVRSIWRGIIMSVIFVIMTMFISAMMQVLAITGQTFLKDLEPFVICIFSTAISPFLYNSICLAFAYSDRERIEEFLAREEKDIFFKDEMKVIFGSKTTLSEIIASTVVIGAAALIGAFISFGGMFPGGMPLGNLIPFAVMTPICFLISVNSKYEAARLFEKLERINDTEKLFTPWWFVKRIILIVVLYPTGAPLAPLLGFALFSFFNLIVEITEILTVLGAVSAVAIIAFLLWSVRVLNGISKRKKFFKRLKISVERAGYTLENIKTPYISFITSRSHCSFSLSLGEERFDCLMIGTLWKGVPLVFTSPTDARFEHRIGTDGHHFTVNHNIEFYHRGEGERIVIVDPVPKNVFVNEDRRQKRVTCTDTLWNVTVHDADSFIGCLERKCLTGSNKYREN